MTAQRKLLHRDEGGSSAATGQMNNGQIGGIADTAPELLP